MCRVLNVSKSCYYSWVLNGSHENRIDIKLYELVKQIFINSRRRYGTLRIKADLEDDYGVIVSRKLIAKIMKYYNLKAKIKRKFVVTTDSDHNNEIAPNILNRDFYTSTPDKKYVGDITYIQTTQGWLYLATVIDLYSRKVVGWSIDENMKTSLIIDALDMAIKTRNPSSGLIFHSDRGSQYSSNSFKYILQTNNIRQSMSRKGNCWDNAVAESFFHTLKTELFYQESLKNKAKTNEMIFEYIEIFYNRKRRHSYNNYLSPSKFEEKMLQIEMAA
jgi:transposase InsO family protein